MKKKVALHNLGCKVNSYELEAMQQLLEQAGYEIVPFEPGADVYVINTCTVTNIADRKSRQMLHKAKKMNPDAVVVATGCYVQTDEGKLETDEAVDLVLGNNQKKNIVEVLAEFEKDTSVRLILLRLTRQRNMKNWKSAVQLSMYVLILRCRMAATSLHLLYHSLRKRPRAKQGKREYFKRSAQAGQSWLQRSGAYRNSSQFLWSGFS